MAEYIDREKLRDALYEADAITMRGVAILNQFPAADVVPVVRCKDCDSYSKRDGWCRTFEIYQDENGYCSYGERKDGDGDA